MENGRLQSLQVVRFVAASLVIAFHACAMMGGSGPPRPLLTLGPMGVDLFFVLSGYIIATTAPAFSAGAFLARRLTRILPLYYLLTLAMIGLMAWGGKFSPQYLLGSFLLLPGMGKFHYINAAWTLDYEMLFYLATALVLAFRRIALIGVLAAFALATLARSAVGGDLLAYTGNPLIVEFLVGVLLAGMKANAGAGAAALGLGLLLLAPAGLLNHMPEGWARVLIACPPCALIVFGAGQMSGSGPVRRRLAPLGDASYAAYLVHQFPVAFLHPPGSLGPAILLVALAMLLSWVFGVLIYRTVERPWLALLRRRPPATGLPLSSPRHHLEPRRPRAGGLPQQAAVEHPE